MLLTKDDWINKLIDRIEIAADILDGKYPGQDFETIIVYPDNK